MLDNQDRYDAIDRYVTGEMTPQEQESFLSDVKQDQTLGAQLRLVEDIRDGLERRNEKLEQIRLWEEEHRAAANKRRAVMKFSGSLSVAAALVAGVFLSYPTSYAGLQDREFVDEVWATRGSIVDVGTYWEDESYEECLVAIETELQAKARESAELDPETMSPEVLQYNRDLIAISADYLSWANIQTLLKMRHYEEALMAVDAYIASDGDRMDKALKLQKRLRRKLRK